MLSLLIQRITVLLSLFTLFGVRAFADGGFVGGGDDKISRNWHFILSTMVKNIEKRGSREAEVRQLKFALLTPTKFMVQDPLLNCSGQPVNPGTAFFTCNEETRMTKVGAKIMQSPWGSYAWADVILHEAFRYSGRFVGNPITDEGSLISKEIFDDQNPLIVPDCEESYTVASKRFLIRGVVHIKGLPPVRDVSLDDWAIKVGAKEFFNRCAVVAISSGGLTEAVEAKSRCRTTSNLFQFEFRTLDGKEELDPPPSELLAFRKCVPFHSWNK